MLIPFKELEELALRAGVIGVKANTFWSVSNTFGLTSLTPSNYFNSFSSEELEELALRAGVKGVKANTLCLCLIISSQKKLSALTPNGAKRNDNFSNSL